MVLVNIFINYYIIINMSTSDSQIFNSSNVYFTTDNQIEQSISFTPFDELLNDIPNINCHNKLPSKCICGAYLNPYCIVQYGKWCCNLCNNLNDLTENSIDNKKLKETKMN